MTSYYLFGIGSNTPDLGEITAQQLEKWAKLAISEKAPTPLTPDSYKHLMGYPILPQGFRAFTSSPWQHILAVEQNQVASGKWESAYHCGVLLADVGRAWMHAIADDPDGVGERERQLNMRLQYSRNATVIASQRNKFPDGAADAFDKFHFDRMVNEKALSTKEEFKAWKALAVAQKAEDGQSYRPLMRAWVSCSGGLKVSIDHMFFNRVNVAFKMTEEQKQGMKAHVCLDLSHARTPCKNQSSDGQSFKCGCAASKGDPMMPKLEPASSLVNAQAVAAAAPPGKGLAAILNGAIGGGGTEARAPAAQPPKETTPAPGDSKNEKVAPVAVPPSADDTTKKKITDGGGGGGKMPKRKRPPAVEPTKTTVGEAKGTPTSPEYPPADDPYLGTQPLSSAPPAPAAPSKSSKGKEKPSAASRFKTKPRPALAEQSQQLQPPPPKKTKTAE